MQASIGIAQHISLPCNALMALGENIATLRKKKGWSTHDLALECDIAQSSISRYEGNLARPRPAALQRIALALGADVTQLEYGTADFEAVPLGKRRIPILDYVQAGRWTGVDTTIRDEEMLGFTITDAVYSKDAFGLIVRGDSMVPDFQEGDILTIDPAVKPHPGDYVIAVDGSGEASFKRYAHVGTTTKGHDIIELRPLNPFYPVWNSEATKFRIVGTMMECTRRFRKNKSF